MFRFRAKTFTAAVAFLVLLPAFNYGWARDRLIESALGPIYLLSLAGGGAGLLALWSNDELPGRWRALSLALGLAVGFTWSVLLRLQPDGGAVAGLQGGQASAPGRADALLVGLGGPLVLAFSWLPASWHPARRQAGITGKR